PMSFKLCTCCKGPCEAGPVKGCGDLSICRRCAPKILAYMAEALGAQELRRLVGEATDDRSRFGDDRGDANVGRKWAALISGQRPRGGPSPGELSLIARAELAREQAAYERRGLTPTELSLSLQATAIVQRDKTLAAMGRTPVTLSAADIRA